MPQRSLRLSGEGVFSEAHQYRQTMWGITKRFRISNPESPSHLELGERGEKLAASFLRKHDYRIVVTNFVAPIGHSKSGRPITGEIDIIAYDESSLPFILTFIEVKTRTSAEIAAPEAAVDLKKQRQIVRASRVYRRLLSIADEPYRYDVVSIILARDKEMELTLFRGYFTDEKFERSKWIARTF